MAQREAWGMTDTATPKKPGGWSGLVAWLDRGGGPALAIAFFSALAALISAGVALFQIIIFMNERSTPYRTAVHIAQMEVAREITATSVQYWEALDAGLAGCRGMLETQQLGWTPEVVRARFDQEAKAYYEFRKALYGGRAVFSPSVMDAGQALADVIYSARNKYGSRTCDESLELDDTFLEDEEAFMDAHFGFLNAVRSDAKIDELSERPDMQMPK